MSRAMAFYRGAGAEATALADQAMALLRQSTTAWDKLRQSLGADALQFRCDGVLEALLWEIEDGEDAPTVDGLRCIGRDISRTHWAFVPAKRTERGQQIVQQVRAIAPFQLSHWLCQQLGAARWLPNPAPATWTFDTPKVAAAGIYAGAIYLQTPAIPADPFTPPRWLQPISEAEFLRLLNTHA